MCASWAGPWGQGCATKATRRMCLSAGERQRTTQRGLLGKGVTLVRHLHGVTSYLLTYTLLAERANGTDRTCPRCVCVCVCVSGRRAAAGKWPPPQGRNGAASSRGCALSHRFQPYHHSRSKYLLTTYSRRGGHSEEISGQGAQARARRALWADAEARRAGVVHR